jgi:hypothetical protein
VRRFQGYQEACIDLGLRPRPHHVVHDLRSAESAARLAIGQLNDLLGDDLAAAYLIGGRCGPRTAAGPTQRWACGVDR